MKTNPIHQFVQRTLLVHRTPRVAALLTATAALALTACTPPEEFDARALVGAWVLHHNADGVNLRQHATFNTSDNSDILLVNRCTSGVAEEWQVNADDQSVTPPDEEAGSQVNHNKLATASDGDEGWHACRVSWALSFAAGDFSLSHNDEVLFTQTEDVCAWTTAINESGVATVFEDKAARLKLALTADAWVVGDNPVSGEIHVDSRDINVFVSGTLTLDEQVGADWRGAFVLHDDNPAADASADAFTGTIDVALQPECER